MAELLVASGSRRISALTLVSGISGSTAMPIVMGGNTVQVTHTNFLATTLLNQSNTFSGNNTFGGQTTLLNGLVNGDLVVKGDLTANQYIISSSVSHITSSFSSGSTIFGDSLDDTHQFTGSVSITGSFLVNGIGVDGSSINAFTQSVNIFSASVADEVNSLQDVTASYVLTSSLNAYTASNDGRVTALTNVFNSYTASNDGRVNSLISVTGSYASTASLNAYTASNDAKINSLISVTGSYATTGSNIFVGNQTITGSLNAKDGGFSVSSGSGFLTSSLAFTHNTISPTQGYSLLTLRHINNDFNENFALKLFADDYIAKIQYEQNNVTYDILRTNLAGDVHLTQNTRLFGTDLTIDGALEAKQNARVTGSLVVSGSGVLIGNQTITGSLIVSGSSTFTNIGLAKFTGSVGVSGSVNADSFTLDATSTSNIPALNSTFNLDLSGSGEYGGDNFIKKTLVLGDGKILIAGRFQSIDGHTTNDIARLNSNGTIDTGFTSPIFGYTFGGDYYGYINTFVTQSDNKILVGGTFDEVDGGAREGIARLNANGSLDSSFAVQSWSSFAEVKDIAIQNDGKIVCVGYFTSGSRRINTDGTLDTSFNVSTGSSNPSFFNNDYFYSVALLNSGSEQAILIGGEFQQWGSFSDYNYLVKLNPSGSLDFGFAGTNLDIATIFEDRIQKIKVGDDGYVYVAGRFRDTGIGNNAGFARITTVDEGNGVGAIDTGFRTYITTNNSFVNDFDFYNGDKILLGGSFTLFGNPSFSVTSANRFVIIDQNDGGLVSNWSSDGLATKYNLNTGSINSVTLLPNDNVLVGGTFTSASFPSTAREGLASLKLAGLGVVTTTTDYSITADTTQLLISSSNTYFSGNVNISGSITGSTNFNTIVNKPTLVSGSSQVSYPDLSNIPNGIISSSAQIDLLFDIDGLVSSSQQVRNYGIFATTGSNTFIGNQIVTGSVTISGSISQTGVGDQSIVITDAPITTLTTATGLTAIGYGAGEDITSGYDNTFIGNQAGRDNNTGYVNTFVGGFAGSLNTSGIFNTFVGRAAGQFNTTGEKNTYIGTLAGQVSTGNYNTFLGTQAGALNTSAGNNTFIGTEAGSDNTLGTQNTFVGRLAGENNSVGNNNTILGASAGNGIQSGSSNTFVGRLAGAYIVDGLTALSGSNNSVFLGTETKANANSETNQIVIGHGVIGNGSNTVVIGNASITSTTLRGSVSASLFSGSFVGNGSGLFTGSFVGNGSGLTDVVETGSFATTGSNTFIGNQIVTGSVTISGSISQVGVGDSNIIIRQAPLNNLTTAEQNVIIGSGAGLGLTTGFGNTYIGFSVGSSNQTGNNQTFVGTFAGRVNTANENTFVGSNSGYFNTTGTGNAFFGYYAGYRNTTANNNTFIGDETGFNNTIGANNTFIGQRAGNFNSTAQNNTFVGSSAGEFNTSGSGNTFIGQGAGTYNTTANYNAFIGHNAGRDTSVGTNNTFVGPFAGQVNISGSHNTFIGSSAGVANTQADSNTFVGSNAGSNNSVGTDNTFVGRNAGTNTTSGSGNSFFGRQAAAQNNTGANNSTFGFQAGQFNQSGSNNTFFGKDAGTYLGNGSSQNNSADNSVFLGMSSRANGSAQTNQIVIGYQAIGNGSNTATLGNDSITDTYLKGTVHMENGYSILTQVSQSLEFANDAAAAAGGVPLGGLYRSGNFILIRLV